MEPLMGNIGVEIDLGGVTVVVNDFGGIDFSGHGTLCSMKAWKCENEMSIDGGNIACALLHFESQNDKFRKRNRSYLERICIWIVAY